MRIFGRRIYNLARKALIASWLAPAAALLLALALRWLTASWEGLYWIPAVGAIGVLAGGCVFAATALLSVKKLGHDNTLVGASLGLILNGVCCVGVISMLMTPAPLRQDIQTPNLSFDESSVLYDRLAQKLEETNGQLRGMVDALAQGRAVPASQPHLLASMFTLPADRTLVEMSELFHRQLLEQTRAFLGGLRRMSQAGGVSPLALADQNDIRSRLALLQGVQTINAGRLSFISNLTRAETDYLASRGYTEGEARARVLDLLQVTGYPHLRRVALADDRLLDIAGNLLHLLDSEFGHWSVDQAHGRITFDRIELLQEFNRLMAQYQGATQDEEAGLAAYLNVGNDFAVTQP